MNRMSEILEAHNITEKEFRNIVLGVIEKDGVNLDEFTEIQAREICVVYAAKSLELLDTEIQGEA